MRCFRSTETRINMCQDSTNNLVFMNLSNVFRQALIVNVIFLAVNNWTLFAQNKPQQVTQTPVAVSSPVVRDAYRGNPTINYIKVWEPLGAYSDPGLVITEAYQHIRQTTQYFDGLGRPV